MQVFLKAIKFNHDPTSATGDAFNIRRNETEVVQLPEWQRGISFNPEDSPAAYAIRETRGNQITIQARFKCTGTDKRVQVRAVEARGGRHSVGCSPIGFLLPIFSRQSVVGNVLGQVKAREIEFKDAGETGFETFELQNVRLWSAGVSVSNTEWRWQFRVKSGDHWTDFALSRHRIFTILSVPGCPWEQTGYNEENTQLPWTEALEFVCDWAAGTHDPDDAASLVTRNIHDLGLRGVIYSESPLYSCPNFNCTQFLDLLEGGTGMGKNLNCSDCASAVSSFANLLGCDLRQVELGPDQIQTKPIRKIGQTRERITVFFGHEVAWKGSLSEDGEIFDACFKVDGDEHPDHPPFNALLPTKMRFGKAGDKHYRFRVSPELILKPETRSCRKIGFSVPGECNRLNNKELEFLKLRFDYDNWKDLEFENDLSLTADGIFEKALQSEYTLKFPEPQAIVPGSVKTLQSLALFHEDKEAIIRLDLVEWANWQEAREFMLRELGDFRELHVERLINPKIGDVSFMGTGEVSVLFARSRFVSLVRSVGTKPISVRQAAIRINHSLA